MSKPVGMLPSFCWQSRAANSVLLDSRKRWSTASASRGIRNHEGARRLMDGGPLRDFGYLVGRSKNGGPTQGRRLNFQEAFPSFC
jgi:hypothetical protein